MNITDEKLSELTTKLTVQIEPEDYRDNVHSVLKDYAKKVNLKGFRPGKVPVRVVKKMYGAGVLLEELNKIVSQELGQYIEEKSLPVVGEPLPLTTDIDLEGEEDSNYDFEFEVGLFREFDVDYGLAGENSLYNISIDDETLDKEVENLQKTYGPMSNPESSQEGDTLFGKLMQLGEDGEPVEDGYSRMYALNPERVQDEAFKEKMAGGLKPEEDHLELRMEEIVENDHEMRRVWENNVQNEKIRDVSDEDLEAIKGMTFRFEVRKINRIEPMEVGQELFDKAFGEGNISSEEEMRTKLGEDMTTFFEREAQRFYRSKTIKALLEGVEIDLPDEFLQRWLVRTREQVTEENIGDLYESYSRSLKWRLIVEKMQRDNPALIVEEEDLREQARIAVMQQFGSMLGDAEPEKMDNFVDYFLKDEKMSGRLFDEVLERKIFTVLEEKNPPASEDITASEFLEVLKAEK